MEPINIIDVKQLTPEQQLEIRLQKLRSDFENMIQDHVVLSMTADRMAHRYGIIAQKQEVTPINVATNFEKKTIHSAWSVLENEQNKDEIFKAMEQCIFDELNIQQEPTGNIIPELFKLLNKEEYNREILSIIANEQLIDKTKYILTNILIDPALQVSYFKGEDRKNKFKEKFTTQLTEDPQAQNINIGIQTLENDGKTISVVCGASGNEMKRRESIPATNYQENPMISVVGNRTYILPTEVLLMPKLIEYLQEKPELFTGCFIGSNATGGNIEKLIKDLQTVKIPENFEDILKKQQKDLTKEEQKIKTNIVNQYTKILTENMFSIEPAMQVKNYLDKNNEKEIKLLRVSDDQEVIDETITYDPNINYIIYNVTDLIQTKNDKGELTKISSDTSSNANAILFTKEQYPNLLPNNAKYCIFTNSLDENRMLRTFNTIFGNTNCIGAISDIRATDINTKLDKTNMILVENVKLWHLQADLGNMSEDGELVSDKVKQMVK